MAPGNDQRRPVAGSGVEKVNQAASTIPPTTDIGAVHRMAYAAGVDAIDNAIQHVQTFLAAADSIAVARRGNSAAFPTVPSDAGAGYWARRIVGELLDAGWTPPDLGAVSDG